MMCHHHRPLGIVVVRLLPAMLLVCGAVWACVRVTTWSAVPGSEMDLAAEVRRGQQLDDSMGRVLERLNEKQRLTLEVSEGRLTLLTAAARFRDLDQQPPAFPSGLFRTTYEGGSDDERHCREVITFVQSALACQPPETAAPTIARLEAELQQLLDRDEVHLPGSDTEATH